MDFLPKNLNEVLSDKIYKRINFKEIKESLNRLGVQPSSTFMEFYNNYAGSFGSDESPYELLDLCENGNRNIEKYTYIARKEHNFPNKYLVLTEMISLSILVLDSETDKIYEVDFEGGDKLLINGSLKPTWNSFYRFLEEYFSLT